MKKVYKKPETQVVVPPELCGDPLATTGGRKDDGGETGGLSKEQTWEEEEYVDFWN